MTDRVLHSLSALESYCRRENYTGWDPYDGLNSRLFKGLPLLRNSRYARLFWIQAFKRSPLNLRKPALVPKSENPKAIALFLKGYCNLWKMSKKADDLEQIAHLANRLMTMITPGWSGACWGYPFDWQARAFFQPAGTPTIVASSFAGDALLDAFDILKEKKLLSTARSVADFIRKDLNKTTAAPGQHAWSYSPADRTTVYNASLLGACLMARLFSHTGEHWLQEEALGAVNFCAEHQNPDGSWFYSPLPHHQWIDNFHTGFNLESIAGYATYTGDDRFDECFDRGFRFWTGNLFTPEGIPCYYTHSVWPADLHATAELILACVRSGRFIDSRDLIDRVLQWSIDHMQSPSGYFYYQRNRFMINRIPYMRWTQAWMFAAMTAYLLQSSHD